MKRPEIIERKNKIDDINEKSRRQYEEFQLSLIFRTPINGNVAIDNQSNRGFILGWLQEDQGESICATWFQKVLKENPVLARQLSWQSSDVLDPRKQKDIAEAQAEQDRETFNQFARENGFSECESNHLLVNSFLGNG